MFRHPTTVATWDNITWNSVGNLFKEILFPEKKQTVIEWSLDRPLKTQNQNGHQLIKKKKFT